VKTPGFLFRGGTIEGLVLSGGRVVVVGRYCLHDDVTHLFPFLMGIKSDRGEIFGVSQENGTSSSSIQGMLDDAGKVPVLRKQTVLLNADLEISKELCVSERSACSRAVAKSVFWLGTSMSHFAEMMPTSRAEDVGS